MPAVGAPGVVRLGAVYAREQPVPGAPWRIVASVEVVATRDRDGHWAVSFDGRAAFRWAAANGDPLTSRHLNTLGDAKAWLDSSPQGAACRRRLMSALRYAADARLEDFGDGNPGPWGPLRGI